MYNVYLHIYMYLHVPTSIQLPVLADVGDTVVEAQTQQLGRVGQLGSGRIGTETMIQDTLPCSY